MRYPHVPKPSTRSFSKRVAMVCIALGWGLAFWATYHQQGAVATSALGLITAFFGIYAGVGHMDLRQMAGLVAGGLIETAANDMDSAPGPPDAGDGGAAG
jgi:hypothetical protein